MTAPSSAGPERETMEALAEVLIRHQRIPLYDDTRGQRCVGCDDLRGETDGPNSPRHADHLARVILASPWLAAYVAAAADDGRREGAETALRGIRFRLESACDGYAALQLSDVPEDIFDEDSYIEGARDAADAIRAATEGERA